MQRSIGKTGKNNIVYQLRNVIRHNNTYKSIINRYTANELCIWEEKLIFLVNRLWENVIVQNKYDIAITYGTKINPVWSMSLHLPDTPGNNIWKYDNKVLHIQSLLLWNNKNLNNKYMISGHDSPRINSVIIKSKNINSRRINSVSIKYNGLYQRMYYYQGKNVYNRINETETNGLGGGQKSLYYKRDNNKEYYKSYAVYHGFENREKREVSHIKDNNGEKVGVSNRYMIFFRKGTRINSVIINIKNINSNGLNSISINSIRNVSRNSMKDNGLYWKEYYYQGKDVHSRINEAKTEGLRGGQKSLYYKTGNNRKYYKSYTVHNGFQNRGKREVSYIKENNEEAESFNKNNILHSNSTSIKKNALYRKGYYYQGKDVHSIIQGLETDNSVMHYGRDNMYNNVYRGEMFYNEYNNIGYNEASLYFINTMEENRSSIVNSKDIRNINIKNKSLGFWKDIISHREISHKKYLKINITENHSLKEKEKIREGDKESLIYHAETKGKSEVHGNTDIIREYKNIKSSEKLHIPLQLRAEAVNSVRKTDDMLRRQETINEINKIVERKIKGEIKNISGQVYESIERRLKAERRRRGI